MVVNATEKKVNSQEKNILQEISFKEFTAICLEYKLVEKSTLALLSIAESSNSTMKEKIDIYKWIIEMNIGKPRQMIEQNNSFKERISGYTFEIVNSLG